MGAGASGCSSGNPLEGTDARHEGTVSIPVIQKSSSIPGDFEISWSAKRETKSAPKNKNARKKTTKTRARLVLYQAERTAAQNCVNKNTDAYKYKAESDISFTKAKSSAAQNHVNQITDV